MSESKIMGPDYLNNVKSSDLGYASLVLRRWMEVHQELLLSVAAQYGRSNMDAVTEKLRLLDTQAIDAKLKCYTEELTKLGVAVNRIHDQYLFS